MQASDPQTLFADQRERPSWQKWAFVLLIFAFALYAHFRTRYVGGCDSWAYYAQALAVSGIDAGLELELDPREHPPLIPLCHEKVGEKIVSIFPPGFPLLLALARLVGLEFHLNPLLGVLTIGLLLALLWRQIGYQLALGLALFWALFPMTVWGSTQLMSDLPATAFLLFSYLLLHRDRPVPGGIILGLSLGIRPTNILFLIPAIILARKRQSILPLVVALVASAALWPIYFWIRHGSLWVIPYTTNLHNLGITNFFKQATFLLTTTVTLFWPILFFAVYAVFKRPAESAAPLSWFVAFVLFCSLWKHEFNAWWNTRFLLPAYPALVILAGIGTREFIKVLTTRWSWPMHRCQQVAGAIFIGGIVFAAIYGVKKRAYSTDFDIGYYRDSLRIREQIDSKSLVAAVNFTGPLRLYARRESFDWRHPEAFKLTRWALTQKRAVYLVIEPWEKRIMGQFKARYQLKEITRLSKWPNLKLYQLVGPARKLPRSSAGR